MCLLFVFILWIYFSALFYISLLFTLQFSFVLVTCNLRQSLLDCVPELLHTQTHIHTNTPACVYPFLQSLSSNTTVILLHFCVNIMNVYTQRTTNMRIIYCTYSKSYIQYNYAHTHTLYAKVQCGVTQHMQTTTQHMHTLNVHTDTHLYQDRRNSQWMRQFTGVLPVLSPADISHWDSGRLWLVSMYFLYNIQPFPTHLLPFLILLHTSAHSYAFFLLVTMYREWRNGTSCFHFWSPHSFLPFLRPLPFILTYYIPLLAVKVYSNVFFFSLPL